MSPNQPTMKLNQYATAFCILLFDPFEWFIQILRHFQECIWILLPNEIHTTNAHDSPVHSLDWQWNIMRTTSCYKIIAYTFLRPFRISRWGIFSYNSSMPIWCIYIWSTMHLPLSLLQSPIYLYTPCFVFLFLSDWNIHMFMLCISLAFRRTHTHTHTVSVVSLQIGENFENWISIRSAVSSVQWHSFYINVKMSSFFSLLPMMRTKYSYHMYCIWSICFGLTISIKVERRCRYCQCWTCLLFFFFGKAENKREWNGNRNSECVNKIVFKWSKLRAYSFHHAYI